MITVGANHPKLLICTAAKIPRAKSQASASIAQVHAGRLLDGTEVVIKVSPADGWAGATG